LSDFHIGYVSPIEFENYGHKSPHLRHSQPIHGRGTAAGEDHSCSRYFGGRQDFLGGS
jgi:hypothetical protein